MARKIWEIDRITQEMARILVQKGKNPLTKGSKNTGNRLNYTGNVQNHVAKEKESREYLWNSPGITGQKGNYTHEIIRAPGVRRTA